MLSKCRICSHDSNHIHHTFREMMFGMRDEFEYFECGECGTIQIATVPDLEKYYPRGYPSLGSDTLSVSRWPGAALAARTVGKFYLNPEFLPGRILNYLMKFKSDVIEKSFPFYLRETFLNISFKTKILDFGSGRGHTLSVLRYYGFDNLTGSDRFIDSPAILANGIRLEKKDLAEFKSGEFELVMMNHVLEHLEDPRNALAEAFRILPKGGFCLIRIPIVSNAWMEYGRDWYQLDPPRHLYLFTEAGFLNLAGEVGFTSRKVKYDSDELQFVISEFYKRDMPMKEATKDQIVAMFGEEQIEEWKSVARDLNEAGRGDQACFFLQKP